MLPAVSPHLQALQSAHDGYILVSSVSLELLDVIYTELLIKGGQGGIYSGPQSTSQNFQRNRNVGFIFNYKMYIGFAHAGGNYKMYMFI